MKFLVDVGVGKKVELWLNENGFDVKSVRGINPKASDSEILAWAVREKRMLSFLENIHCKSVGHHE